MSIDLAKRAYLAAWNDAVTYSTRNMSADAAFELWWKRELALLEPLPTPLLDKETLQPVEPFDFSKLPRPGDAHYQPRMREFIEGMGMKIASPGTGQSSIMGDNSEPYEAQGVKECAASGAGCSPVNTRKGVLCRYCGRDMSND